MRPLPIAEIDPQRRYSLVDAALFCPSPRGGTLSPGSLRNPAKSGALKAEKINGFWYCWGADLLKYLGVENVEDIPNIRSASKRQQAYERAKERLRKRGMKF